VFKIIQQPNKLYTLTRYYYSEQTNTNKELWTANNLTESLVSEMMKGRSEAELEPQDWAFVVLQSSDGPAILASNWNRFSSSSNTTHYYV